MDRRTRKTEKALISALLHFLSEKELHQITVKELCDHADINRSTFYLHFYDIYDLLDRAEQQLVDAIYTPISPDNNAVLYDIINTFEYIREHKDEYRVIFNINHGLGFTDKLMQKTITQFMPQIKEIIPEYSDQIAHAAAIMHIGGAMALLYDWVVSNDCSIPPAEIIQAVSRMTDAMYKQKQSYLENLDMENIYTSPHKSKKQKEK